MRIGYAKASIFDHSLEDQVERLKEAGCERTVVEKSSGPRIYRPELARLLRGTLREGDTLVVWTLDRLASTLKQLVATTDDLKGQGVGLVSIGDAIDTSSPGGMMVFHMLGTIAEFERVLIRERTIEGLLKAKRKGKAGGRPRRLSSGDAEAAKVLLAGGGLSVKEVAARFGISKATLYRHVGKGAASA